MFHMFTKIGGNTSKMIADKSNINTESFSTMEKFELANIAHPQPYNMSWIDTPSERISKDALSLLILLQTRLIFGLMLSP